jgi:hypothetical protein
MPFFPILRQWPSSTGLIYGQTCIQNTHTHHSIHWKSGFLAPNPSGQSLKYEFPSGEKAHITARNIRYTQKEPPIRQNQKHETEQDNIKNKIMKPKKPRNILQATLKTRHLIQQVENRAHPKFEDSGTYHGSALLTAI